MKVEYFQAFTVHIRTVKSLYLAISFLCLLHSKPTRPDVRENEKKPPHESR